MADVSLELDYAPTDFTVEWPFIYVVGSSNGDGGVYTQRVVKYQVRGNSIDVVDDATHLSQVVFASYSGCSLGALSTDSLFCCGSQKSGATYYGVVRKVNKNDLSDVTWSCLEAGETTSGYWSSVKEDSSGIIFTAGSYGGVGRGWTSRINASGVRTHIASNVYSTLNSVLSFVSVGGTDYVEITGSYGGYRFIYRYRTSDLFWADNLTYKYGQNIVGNLYIWYKAATSSELGTDYYYLPGWTGVDAYHPEQSTLKMDRSKWALGYPNANVWESRRDMKADWITEYEQVCVVDGTYVYSSGLFNNAQAPAPVLPLTATFRKLDYNGVQQWAVNHSSTNRAPYYGFGQYGNYIITSLYDATGATPLGWLEFRNKSDGLVSVYPLVGVGAFIALSTGVIANACYVSENATPQTFEVWNSDSDTLNYTISDDVAWLTCMPTSGSLTGADFDTITVNYNTSALAIGVHTATITITDPDAGNTPQTINVTLNVAPPDPRFYMHGMKWFSTGEAPFRGPEYKGCYLGCRP